MIDLDYVKHLLQLLGVSILAVGAHMRITKQAFTCGAYFANLIMAIFAAYLANSACDYLSVDKSLVPAVIGVASFTAPHLLLAINAIGDRISKNPILALKFLSQYRVINKSKKDDGNS